MKTNALFLLTFLFLAFTSCNSDDDATDYELVQVASPITMSLDALRNSVTVVAPKPIEESGKIYVRESMVLVNDKGKGIHVIDNSNPETPQKVAYLEIPGNNDMEVKGSYLYADSYMDLVVFDISDVSAIKEVSRIESVFPYYPAFPEGQVYFDYENYQYTEETIIVGWEVKEEFREVVNNPDIFMFSDAAELANVSQSVGKGGSLARFKIVDNFLYAVDSHNINIFDISNTQTPEPKEDVMAGFDIETIFNQGDYLFLGSMQGMYIYNIEDPGMPTFVSEFRHGTACDPVVVDGNYAYVTLRGGNLCGATESSLLVIDIEDITKPKLASSYTLERPYGLGVNAGKLYVCDKGLKVFDVSNVPSINFLTNYDVASFDVIPLESHLLMIGENTMYQYNYEENGLSLLSEFTLN